MQKNVWREKISKQNMKKKIVKKESERIKANLREKVSELKRIRESDRIKESERIKAI